VKIFVALWPTGMYNDKNCLWYTATAEDFMQMEMVLLIMIGMIIIRIPAWNLNSTFGHAHN